MVSLPNLIMPIFGWLLNVRFGFQLMYVFYGSFIMFGQLILSLGCYYRAIIPMIIGRTIYGCGFQMVNTCKNQMIMHWFYKGEVALPFSICQMVIDFMKFSCFYITPRILNTVIFLNYLLLGH